MTLVNEWIKASKLSSNAGKVKYISFYKPGVNDVISLKLPVSDLETQRKTSKSFLE